MSARSAKPVGKPQRRRAAAGNVRTVRGICLGLAATAIVAVAHWAGLTEQAELLIFDLRFRNLPTVEMRDDIVHIDLDDKSLDQIGRWPWPRRRLAQLVGVLNDCGARAVMLDIILPHPQQPRYVKEGHTDLYTADTGAILNVDAPPVPVLDDVELAEVLSASPDLFLAMHVDIIDKSAGRRRREGLAEDVADMVATRPALTPAQAAAETGAEPSAVAAVIADAKQRAYDRRIEALLRDRADRSLTEVVGRLLGAASPRSEDFDIARRVYLRRRALHVLGEFALPDSPTSPSALPAGRAVPPLVTLAQVISHTGFVTVTPDKDGVVRRIPLLARTDAGVFPQLALALAAETMAADHGGKYVISPQAGKVVITCPDNFKREIPVDSQGYMLINWNRESPDSRGARHISVVAAAGVWQGRDHLRRNRNVTRLACIEIARLLDNTRLLNLFAAADRTWQELCRAGRERQAALLFAPADVPPPPINLLARDKELEEQIDRQCAELIKEVDEFYLAGQARTAPSGHGAQDEQLRKLRSLRQLVRRVEAENARIRMRLDDATVRLRREVAGKICLVGSTATGAADFVPTPVHRRTPGVVVHANILNTILSGKFVRAPPPWVSAMLVILAGTLVALVTSTRGPIESAILLAAAIVGYALVDASVWKGWTYWIVAAGPIGAMLLVFTVITVYRQLTEQRRRRQITSTFKQYLSPAMVDELVNDPSQASLGGQRRQLSCLFSDLAGFTSISERLGAEGTVGLLNRYLDRVGEILQTRYGGTLSKYEGDGLFAFFGAPIPQDDHAARAVQSALDCQAFLPEFSRGLHAEGLLPEGVELTCRIGITAGEVFVGNMGSTQRIAYTAIGDPVNLASRLETANKFFGSAILVNESAWLAGGEGLLGRPMGKILVVGKTEPVAVWEPLGRKADADGQLRKFTEDFARGVELYAAGDFKTARDCFGTILSERDDRPARRYLQLCDDGPNQPDFDGVIRLTEK